MFDDDGIDDDDIRAVIARLHEICDDADAETGTDGSEPEVQESEDNKEEQR